MYLTIPAERIRSEMEKLEEEVMSCALPSST